MSLLGVADRSAFVFACSLQLAIVCVPLWTNMFLPCAVCPPHEACPLHVTYLRDWKLYTHDSVLRV